MLIKEQEITVGIVGHCYIKTEVARFVYERCIEILDELLFRNKVVAFSALAQGADTIFAEAAIALDIPLTIITPFSTYENDFDEKSKLRYQSLKRRAIEEIKLLYREREDKAYLEAMQEVVFRSDVVIAAWDGVFSGRKGGTEDAVRVLKKKQQSWIHIDVRSYAVHYYLPNKLMNCYGSKIK